MREVGSGSLQHAEAIRNAIRKKYAKVSVSAAGHFQYLTGKDGARALGYDPSIINNSAPELLESFCGVGNPFSLGPIRSGGVVLDFGCGAGFDLYVASRFTGASGRVCGVDLTEQMVDRSMNNLARAAVSNFEIKRVDSEHIPYADSTFDIVISNGVINLTPDKQECFREIYRVLKPGARLQFADIVSENELPEGVSGSLEAWSQ